MKTLSKEAQDYLKETFGGLTLDKILDNKYLIRLFQENVDDEQLTKAGDNILDKEIIDALEIPPENDLTFVVKESEMAVIWRGLLEYERACKTEISRAKMDGYVAPDSEEDLKILNRLMARPDLKAFRK